MWFEKAIDSTGIDLLQAVASFAQQRHKVLADNIANIDTPGYKMRDLSIERFQADLAEAVQARGKSSPAGSLDMPAVPLPKVDARQYLLFQDQNNRSVEKQLSALTTNAMLQNITMELLRSRFNLLQQAISLRL